MVDLPQLAYYSPKTQGVSDILSPGSYLAWESQVCMTITGLFLSQVSDNCNSSDTNKRKVTHMAVDGLIQCHSSRDDKKVGS